MTIKVTTQISKIRKTALLASAAIAPSVLSPGNPPQQPAPTRSDHTCQSRYRGCHYAKT